MADDRYIWCHSDDVMAVVKRRPVTVEKIPEHPAPQTYAFYRR